MLGLVALTLGATGHDFFIGDDFTYLYKSYRAQSLADAVDVFGRFQASLDGEVFPAGGSRPALLRPLFAASNWLIWHAAGSDPLGWRLASMAAHAAQATLLAVLAYRISGSRAAALSAAALFALHPATVESTVWISARADLLVGLCMTTALIAWLDYLEAGSRWHLGLCLLAFAAGFGCKEMALSVPGLALAMVPLRRSAGWRRISIGFAYLVVGLALYAALRWVAIGNLHGYQTLPVGLAGKIAGLAAYLGDAARHTLVPGGAAGDGVVASAAGWAFAVACAVLALAGAWRRAWVGVACCSVAYILSTIPVGAWARIEPDGAGTRFLYPTLGFAALGFASLIAPVLRTGGTRRIVASMAILTIAVSGVVGTWHELAPWRTAAQRSEAMILGLAEPLRGKEWFVTTTEPALRIGPAPVWLNAYAVWHFAAHVHILPRSRAQWDADTSAFAGRGDDHPKVAALRWDEAAGRWVGPQ